MKALAFLRRLVHFLGGDQHRYFEIDRRCGIGGERNGSGTDIVGKIRNGKHVGVSESKIQSL